jgi:hypothetical protein
MHKLSSCLLAACFAVATAPLVGCDTQAHEGAGSASDSLEASLTLTSGVTFNANPAGVGQTVTASATYTNQTGAPITVDAIVLAARPPGGTHAGGPYEDFLPYASSTTVQPGAEITVSATRTFAATDPRGAWDVYPTYQDAQGKWHDGGDVSLSVGVNGFDLSSDLALSASVATSGQTITGTVTYTNSTSLAVNIRGIVIAARPPGGSHAGGPYADFGPSAPSTTVAPGASITLAASRGFSANDPAGAWDVYATYQDDGGAWHDGPDHALTVSAPVATHRFSIANGQILAPDSSVFIARGINVYDGSQGQVSTNAAGQPLTTLFPGVNFIRLATFQYSDPSYFQAFVQTMTAHKIVVEIEHHSGAGGGVAPLTGQALIDESNWFATLASAFKDNPYVWFGTLNEPSGPGSDLTAEQVSNYDAIRGAGNDTIIMMEILGDYASGTMTVGAGHGLIASSYASMRNIVWDFHYYNWLSGYAPDVATNASLLASYIGQSQTISSADGTVPVIIGEYGVSTDGTKEDAGGTASCIAVQASGVGSAAWNWYSYAASDNLTDDNNNLTSYGNQVASFINGH